MRLLLICAASLALATGAQSQSQPVEGTVCPDAYTQPELNVCARDRFVEADAELNRAYRELMRSGEESDDEGAKAYRQRQKNRYREAQRAWIPFRDAHCEAVSNRYEGGSMRPMVKFLCLEQATRERTAQLREHLAPLGG